MFLRRRIAAFAVAGGVLFLAGCGGAAVPSDGPLGIHPRPDAGMDALIMGVLRTDAGCVRIESPTGAGEDVALTFPSGDAEMDGDALVWRGDTYVDGEEVFFGGGFSAVDGYLPDGCRGLELFVVSPF
ncbi:hypothetical protein [Microbacterium aurantiacum]|uniref:Lipoprotein n=1 Tax=Microbacterium aurantiacum TaxID=162393 RepID=A0A0M8MKP1_9MICO|nr:hypothetical protein [Microbacterium chocolatum]ANG84820.1 hypothetical protein A8L33_04955 [Microbacterium chocolatum]KOS12077.1 hypothetical protein XI38_01330 [Microbacterium chocolatum]